MLTIRYAEIAAEQLKAIAPFDKKSAGTYKKAFCARNN